MRPELTLAIDVGTGSARAALMNADGAIVVVAARELAQTVRQFGWSEQQPLAWWSGVVASVHDLLAQVPDARGRIAMVLACGQMHGTVLLDAAGALTRDTAPLWNDKRTSAHVAAYEAAHADSDFLPRTANPATPAWPAFKLQWLRDNDAQAYQSAWKMLVPKDFINFKLTGVAAIDRTEAACSFLMDPATGHWSAQTCDEMGLDIDKLPPIRKPLDILGAVTQAAAAETGLAAGTPVLVGASDFATALLGSGVCQPGMGSEMIGSSCIVTLVAPQPTLHSQVCNLGTVEGHWGAFMLLESGGDAMRWARRALHGSRLGYAELVAHAATAAAGSQGLFFVPYLTGQRLGRHRNARAQFFGLGAAHGSADMDRAVLEGVAFAVQRHITQLQTAQGRKLERLVASGGGARTALWLRIKASVYGLPIAVPREAECGLVGCAAMAQTALGRFSSVQDAAQALVKYQADMLPDPRWQDIYRRMQPVFEKLLVHAQAMYDDLDTLTP
ncbi:xylulokinase [Verminephrobacter eiseniae]|uniref:xylulokinase n=1 Tax=Verminephrobacter eiseniae TaxID=364317 RepID=UPI0022371773|nr:FGGY family carbohydrate kinase [Verminephrobacter eiseniae]MCW5238944.1 pentose kinase [Verminephrobacter eiseniae]